MEERTLLFTLTGEYFQPVRLHYRVSDRPAVLQRFQELRCVDYDGTRGRWVWLYDHEARRLRFKKSYAALPKHLHPVVIGSFFLRAEDKHRRLSQSLADAADDRLATSPREFRILALRHSSGDVQPKMIPATSSGRRQAIFAYCALHSQRQDVMADFTPTQGRYLSFIQADTDLHGYPPAESEIAAAMGF